MVNFALVAAFAFIVLLIMVRYFWSTTSILYFALFPSIVFFTLVALIGAPSSKKVYLIILVVMLQLIVLGLVTIPSGTLITERTQAIASLAKDKIWNPQLSGINSYYNPFPMDVGLFNSFSQVTAIFYSSNLCQWVVGLFFVVGYDLVLFSLTKEVGRSWRMGVLSILLLTFTPILDINAQPEFIASLFVLIVLFVLLISLKRKPSLINFAFINILYFVAILTHGTAAIFVVASFVLILILDVMVLNKGWNLSAKVSHLSFVVLIFVSTLVLTFVRWIFLGGITPVLIPLSGLFSFLNKISGVATYATYVPLYNQVANPFSAYAWIIAASLSLGYLLYQVKYRHDRKSIDVAFLIALCLSAACLAAGGFLGTAVLGQASLQRYLGYAGMVLFVPVAAVAGMKILRSSSRKVMCLALISIVLFSAVGIFDPELSPQLYPSLTTVSAPVSADLIEAQTLSNILSSSRSVVSNYEILNSFGYLSQIGALNNSVSIYSTELNNDRAAINQLSSGEVQPNRTYIWTPEIIVAANSSLLNVVYNSGRYVAVQSSP